jgi:DnaK suppressor protein
MSKVMIDEGYRPTDDEPFMNERQREYFRRKLSGWKQRHPTGGERTLQALQSENENHPDLADRASSETDRAVELRARDRQRKLIAKIESAIARLNDGSYGYCEERGSRSRCAPGSPADRHPVHRGAGAPRAERAGPPRGLSAGGVFGPPNRRRSSAGSAWLQVQHQRPGLARDTQMVITVLDALSASVRKVSRGRGRPRSPGSRRCRTPLPRTTPRPRSRCPSARARPSCSPGREGAALPGRITSKGPPGAASRCWSAVNTPRGSCPPANGGRRRPAPRP